MALLVNLILIWIFLVMLGFDVARLKVSLMTTNQGNKK